MELQISLHLHPEISPEAVVWSGEARIGIGVLQISRTERMPKIGDWINWSSRLTPRA